MDAAGLDAGELQQHVDEFQQPLGVTVGEGEPFPVVGREYDPPSGREVFKRSEQERERGAEFVADVREEGGLGGVELGHGLRATPLLLECPGCRDRGFYLARDQIEEAAVRFIKPPEIIEARNETAHAVPVGRLRDRQDECRAGAGHLSRVEPRSHVLDEHWHVATRPPPGAASCPGRRSP